MRDTSSEFECPVCLTVQNATFPFDCGHGLCKSCDTEMFCRADDRCPVCRKTRLLSSTSSYMCSGDVSERRRRSLAQRDVAASTQGIVFFPNVAVVEVNASDFVERREEAPSQSQPQQDPNLDSNIRRVVADPRIHSIVDALLNAERTSIHQFSLVVREFRNQRNPRTRSRGPTGNRT